PANNYGYIGWNMRLPMFADKNVRKALVYGFNRKGFVDAYYKGYADVCNSPISPVSWAYSEDIDKYDYDPQKAEELLDAAGWKKGSDGFRYKDGKKFTIHWLTYTGSKYVDTLIPLLKNDWQKIGVEVIPELM
ncbi:MAG TPA: peptide ABC transporter, partial [Clostridiaceae bacterium]|nr:peptide ABC transporter [Clostridiaceae bacterium]